MVQASPASTGVAVLLSEVCVSGRGKLTFSHSLVPRQGISYLSLFRKPSQNSEGRQCFLAIQFSWVLSLVHSWDSKLHILKDQVLCRLGPSFRASLHAVSDFLCPRQTVPCLCGPRNLCCNTVKSNKQIFCSLSTHPSPANERLFAGTCWVFCPWGGNIPSFKCTPRSIILSPSAILEIPTPFYGASTLLLPRSSCHSSAQDIKSHTSTTSE